ncbi:MAG: carbohydrate kinase family protein [Candidatus Levybacteria bacterium]|nr:carbohydrate kinase family protein [Candidatus Levybacteria bacterium]
MTHDVVTIGNGLIDAFMALDQTSPYVRVDTDNHELCFKYGHKIHVQQCDFLLGGNACNVGVGLSRLGLSTGFVAEIGDDDFAQKILHLLQKESLDLSFLQQTKNSSSSFAVGINVGGDRTLFIDHVHRKHVFDLAALDTKWVYLTSLGEDWKHVYTEIATLSATKKFRLAFSPGTHQLDEPYAEVEQALKEAEMLFVNKEEAMLLAKYFLQKEVSDIPELLKRLHEVGIGIVSITDGAVGSFVIDAKGTIYQLGRLEALVVEKTGAGDAYATGFLSAIIEGKEVTEAMRFGACNAASVIGQIGAEKGLLTKEAMNDMLAKNPEYVPTVL